MLVFNWPGKYQGQFETTCPAPAALTRLPRQWRLSPLKGLALLAGRKLLLADDSIAIQKIVALTFAEEGIEVIAVSDGAEALEKLEETSPDVVLADVFMPRLNGYKVCEHIKQTERLKHIPVMLMVGSFEPFDEVEARRVGADDILSKPFQSIRTLMDKVGALLSRSPSVDQTQGAPTSAATSPADETPLADTLSDIEMREEPSDAVAKEANTLELPPLEVVAPPEEPMTTDELEITTADTQPLSTEIRDRVEHLVSDEVPVVETVLEAETMPTNLNNEVNPETFDRFDDALLELEQYDSGGFDANDEVILDIDFDAPPPDLPPAMPPSINGRSQTGVAVESRFEAPAFSSVFSPAVTDTTTTENIPEGTVSEEIVEELSSVSSPDVVEAAPGAEMASRVEFVSTSPSPGAATPTGMITLDQLSPEVIDAIARRAVELLSEKAVQEIAWEVVPQLSELMIKRRLEEQDSLNK